MKLALTPLAALAVLAGVAHADAALSYKHVNPPMPAEPAPVIRILQPAPEQVNTTHQTQLPGGQSYDQLACLVEDKDRVIRLAADHWTVKPGGAGVLVVIDGIFATTIHDLAKPIRIEDLEPFNNSKIDTIGVSPLASCGWHWIAVMPTAPNGQMLDVPPTLGWYLNQSDNVHWSPRMTLDEEKKQPLIVINWPMMGTYDGGKSGEMDAPSGIVLSTPGKVMFDYTIAQHAGCHVQINFDEHRGDEGDHEIARHGLEIVDHFQTQHGIDQLQFISACANGDGGGGGWSGMHVYTKSPKSPKSRWPTMSAELSAKRLAAEHAAHRIPGKRPYDGKFFAQGGGGLGQLVCPSPLQITNASASFPVLMSTALSLGTVKIAVDANGYIQPQTFKFGKPTRVKGKTAGDDALAEAANTAGVVVSGDFALEEILDSYGNADAASVRLELKIEAFDAAGSKTGRECSQVMRKDGHFVKAATCSHDQSRCGTGGGELPCC